MPCVFTISEIMGHREAMNYTYLHRLYAKRAELEAKLELYDARDCFGDDDINDGTGDELRERLGEIYDEIEQLEHSSAG